MEKPPAIFRVGINMRSVHGGGTLTIAPRSIVLAPGRISRVFARDIVGQLAPIRHTKPTITMIRSRLLPPWLNTFLVIEGDSETAIASFPAWRRNRVLSELRDHDLKVDEQTRLIDMGGRRVRW